jgi:hypothetical protein
MADSLDEEIELGMSLCRKYNVPESLEGLRILRKMLENNQIKID